MATSIFGLPLASIVPLFFASKAVPEIQGSLGRQLNPQWGNNLEKDTQTMMAGLFLLYLIATVLAARRVRNLSIFVFMVALVLSGFWLHHHATVWPDISL